MSIDDILRFRQIILENSSIEPSEHAEILDEDFNMSQHDSDLYRSLAGLVKSNNGVWKSAKQRDYLLKLINGDSGPPTDTSYIKQIYNIDYDPSKDKAFVTITGSVSWSEHGGRGNRPVGWAFVLDDVGVVKKYKLAWKENKGMDRYGRPMRSSMSINNEKINLEWQRPSDVDASHLTNPVAAPPLDTSAHGKHLGTIGERLRNVDCKIESVNGPYSSEFGEFYVSNFRDPANNRLVYFGKSLGEKDATVTLDFTVKRHDNDKKTSEPTTVISRPTPSKVKVKK